MLFVWHANRAVFPTPMERQIFFSHSGDFAFLTTDLSAQRPKATLRTYSEVMYHEYFTYILRCADDSYYIGVTNDYERRVAEHQAGINFSSYTHDRRPVELVHLEAFRDIRDAIAREKQIQKWSRRKKEALINGDMQKLRHFSRRSHLSH